MKLEALFDIGPGSVTCRPSNRLFMTDNTGRPRILCINAGGIGDLHGIRARKLMEWVDADVTVHDIDKSLSRVNNMKLVWRLVRRGDWDLVYQESTGISGGVPLILAAGRGVRYVVSTGDPVGGYFRNVKGPLAGLVFGLYERILYRRAAAFVGWTPYLTGLALQLGARRAATIEGAVDTDLFRQASAEERAAAKKSLGIPPDHIVCGMIGSIKWSPRQRYCYGLELVEALRHIARPDVSMLIVGDGDGLDRLKAQVPSGMGSRCVFTGRVPPDQVAAVLAAMDIGFITQTLDGLGSFRLTTKLPEYLSAGLPVAMSPIPGFFDYVTKAGWPLPALHPGDQRFHRLLADWLEVLDRDDIERRSANARGIARERFDYKVIGPRFAFFISDLLKA